MTIKMKLYNKIFTLGLVASAMAMTGCSNSFLDIEDPTRTLIGEYMSTDEHIQEAVVAAYDPLHWPDWAMDEYNPVNIMSDIMAGDLWVGGSDANDNANWHRMMNFEARPNAVIAGLWTDAYSGVKRCNDVLAYIEKEIAGMTPEKKAYYEAQARVLRVYYYNWLWKFWGMWFTMKQTLKAPTYLGTQYKADEVYGFMMADLEAALALDALPMKETAENLGRVTKAMAYMLYAEIAMYQNDEERMRKSFTYMKEIIDSGKYALNPDYTNIFKESGEWTDESIFEVNYKDDNAIRDWDSPLAAGDTVLPTLISPNNWLGNRADMMVAGDSALCDRKLLTAMKMATLAATQLAGMQEPWARHTMCVIKTPAFSLRSIAPIQATMPTRRHLQNLTGTTILESIAIQRLFSMPPSLLCAAMAQEMPGLSRPVRSRAGVGTIPASLENITEERHLEFVGEGKRYWDVVRLGIASQVLVPDQYGYRTNTGVRRTNISPFRRVKSTRQWAHSLRMNIDSPAKQK